jgi:hypothetical protein
MMCRTYRVRTGESAGELEALVHSEQAEAMDRAAAFGEDDAPPDLPDAPPRGWCVVDRSERDFNV